MENKNTYKISKPLWNVDNDPIMKKAKDDSFKMWNDQKKQVFDPLILHNITPTIGNNPWADFEKGLENKQEPKDMLLRLRTFADNEIEIGFLKGNELYKLFKEKEGEKYLNFINNSGTYKNIVECYAEKSTLLAVTTYHARCFWRKCLAVYGFSKSE